MSETWVTVIALAAITVLIRASGPVLLGGRPLPAALARVVPLIAPAILAALVVTGTLSDENGFAFDERVAGVAAAGAVLALRHDALLTAGAAGVAVTAVLRALL